jgi:hypothetical protein
MTAVKTWVAGVLAWSALGSLVHAAPLSWYGGPNGWSNWYAAQLQRGADFYAPAAPRWGGWGSGAPWWSTTGRIPYAPSVDRLAPQPAPPATLFQAVDTFPPAPTVVAASAPVAVVPAPVDAYINMGAGPYPLAERLTVGGGSSWASSPSVIQAFGGPPSPEQQWAFSQTVLQYVQQTFRNSGMEIRVTTDPGVAARHTMSVVSGAYYGGNPEAIGITEVGGSGFSFIDKLSYAKSSDELAWALAHNISHELMHALGVCHHPDQTGEYLDAATASWEMLRDPNTRFSPEAVELMLAARAGLVADRGALGAGMLAPPATEGDQVLAAPVPEPSTIAIWAVSVLAVGLASHRRLVRRAA